MLPAFFNHTDGDRIGTVIKDTGRQFLMSTPKKVMFSIGVKLYPYGSEINSVRIVVIKLHALEGFDDHGEGGSPNKSKKGSSTKSKRSKSKQSNQGDN